MTRETTQLHDVTDFPFDIMSYKGKYCWVMSYVVKPARIYKSKYIYYEDEQVWLNRRMLPGYSGYEAYAGGLNGA